MREEQPSPPRGYAKGAPFSPIFFSPLTSLIVFVLRRHGVDVWLYSDDALLCLARSWDELEGKLCALLDDLPEFGDFTGFRPRGGGCKKTSRLEKNLVPPLLLLRGLVAKEKLSH